MINIEHNKINNEPYLRVTSDQENHFVKVKGSENEPTNEIMIKGTTTDLEFEEVYVPIEDIKLISTTMKQQREEKKELSKGDGFLVINGKMDRIRTILKD